MDFDRNVKIKIDFDWNVNKNKNAQLLCAYISLYFPNQNLKYIIVRKRLEILYFCRFVML